MAYPNLNLTDDEILELFNKIDIDGDKTVTKQEMHSFIGSVLDAQNNLRFKLDKDL